MAKKRGLGRGLGALIPQQAEGETAVNVRIVPPSSITPNPHQPRTVMDDEKLAELAASIKEHGLIQPLIVTEQNGKLVLIAGERRWRAAKLAKLERIPVVVKEATPQAMLELAIIENVQRADLNPLEEAYAYQALMTQFGLTQDEVAKKMGKGRSTIANLVRLLKLPPNIQQAVSDGIISGAHGRALLPLPTPEAQTNAMNQVVKLNLSVRQTEMLVKLPPNIRRVVGDGIISFEHGDILLMLPTPEAQANAINQVVKLNLSVRQTETLVKHLMATEKPKPVKKKELSPEMTALQSEFEQSLGTKVNIKKSGKGGQVVIHYYSDDDLNAIYDVVCG